MFYLFVVASVVVLLIPGPAVIYIVTRSIDQGQHVCGRGRRPRFSDQGKAADRPGPALRGGGGGTYVALGVASAAVGGKQS